MKTDAVRVSEVENTSWNGGFSQVTFMDFQKAFHSFGTQNESEGLLNGLMWWLTELLKLAGWLRDSTKAHGDEVRESGCRLSVTGRDLVDLISDFCRHGSKHQQSFMYCQKKTNQNLMWQNSNWCHKFESENNQMKFGYCFCHDWQVFYGVGNSGWKEGHLWC